MSKIIDEIGNTYGYLTVLERAPSKNGRAMWLCQCKCGNQVIIEGKKLRSGNTKSCGCLRSEKAIERCKQYHKDMIGKTYGYLKVLDFGGYAIKPDGRKDRKMKCECQLCHSIIEVRASDLKLGKQIACGCINSKGNTYIKQQLNQLNISFASEYRITNCKDKYCLPFDFAFFKDNKLLGVLEYQGIQHFTCEHHGWDNQQKFDVIQKHDQIKFDYCQKNNIKLYYITYKDDIEEKLKEILNELYS